MATTDDEQRYGSLSRNELQEWCAKLGLPPMKSCRVMAESLRSYIQNRKEQRSKSTKISDGVSVLHFAPPNQPDVHLASSKTNKGCTNNEALINVETSRGGIASKNKDGDRSLTNSVIPSQPLFQTVCTNQNTNIQEHETDCEVRMSSYEGPSHSIGTSTSFEVYFSSDEGFDLFVDLNSKPSDWIKKSKDEAHTVRSGSHRNTGRFLRDLFETMENKHKEKENKKHEEIGSSNQKEKTASNFGVKSGNSQETEKENDAHVNCSSICSKGQQELIKYANRRERSDSSQIEEAKPRNVVYSNVKELRKSKRLRADLNKRICSVPRRSPRLHS